MQLQSCVKLKKLAVGGKPCLGIELLTTSVKSPKASPLSTELILTARSRICDGAGWSMALRTRRRASTAGSRRQGRSSPFTLRCVRGELYTDRTRRIERERKRETEFSPLPEFRAPSSTGWMSEDAKQIEYCLRRGGVFR